MLFILTCTPGGRVRAYCSALTAGGAVAPPIIRLCSCGGMAGGNPAVLTTELKNVSQCDHGVNCNRLADADLHKAPVQAPAYAT